MVMNSDPFAFLKEEDEGPSPPQESLDTPNDPFAFLKEEEEAVAPEPVVDVTPEPQLFTPPEPELKPLVSLEQTFPDESGGELPYDPAFAVDTYDLPGDAYTPVEQPRQLADLAEEQTGGALPELAPEPREVPSPAALPFTNSDLSYKAHMRATERFNSLESPTQEDRDKFNEAEKQLANIIVSDVFVDSMQSGFAGERTFDPLIRKVRAPYGDRKPGDIFDVGAFYPEGMFNRLVEREDYAKFVLDRIVKQLHESGASPSLYQKVQEAYEESKDSFKKIKPEDVIVTAEKLRSRSARTYGQLMTIPLNTILMGVSLGVANAAGRVRNPGEPNNSLNTLREYTLNDLSLISNAGLDLSSGSERPRLVLNDIKAAQRIAGRSYQPPPGEVPEFDRTSLAQEFIPSFDDAIKMQTSDILYIKQPKIIKPWQAGLLKHLKKKTKSMGPIPKMHPAREGSERARRDPDAAYEYLKDFAAYSYSDAIQGQYGEMLEGYEPIKPPKGGWTWEAANTNANAKVLDYTLDQIGQATGTKPEERREIDIFGFKVKEPRALAGMAGFLPISPFDSKEDPRNKVDLLPIEVEKENKRRLKQLIKSGEFGEGFLKDHPQGALELLELGSPSSGKYNTVFKEFGRNFMEMMGPRETTRALVMAVAGAKKYALPSLIPYADVGGTFSSDDMLLFGPDDMLPEIMGDLDISEEEVDRFWNDTPGFAVAMIPGAMYPMGKLGSAATRGAGSLGRALIKVAKDPTIPREKKPEAFVRATQDFYMESQGELGLANKRATAQDRSERVVTFSQDEVVQPSETATSLKQQAKKYREEADLMPEGDSGKKAKTETADALDSAAKNLEDVQREAFIEDLSSPRPRTGLDEITPTLEREAFVGPRKPGVSQKRSPGVDKAVKDMEQVVAQEKVDQRINRGKKDYVGSGEKSYTDALRDIARDLDRGRVDKKFLDEFVYGREKSVAETFVQNGVTDPLAYAYLLEGAVVDGPNGIASYVFRAESSKAAKAKARYRADMREVARLRKVPLEEVYKDTNNISIAEDMVKSGVGDINSYLMLGFSDTMAKKYAKQGDSYPQKPKVRSKVFGENVIEPTQEVMTRVGFDDKTVGQLAKDTLYGAARVAFGRKPTNILNNRLREVQGKTTGQKAALLGEASMLATFEFMKSPFAFVNFPSWIGDFSKFMYLNSTGNGAFQKFFRQAFNYALSPSAKLGQDLYMRVVEMAGKRQVRQFEVDALAARLGDEGVQDFNNAVEIAMDEVGLSQHRTGEPDIRLVENNSISAEMKNNTAIAMLAGEGAYIEVAGQGGTKQKLYLQEMFDLEYRVDGEWINAWEATDSIAALRKEKGDLSARYKEIGLEIEQLQKESIASFKEFDRPNPSATTKLAVLKSESDGIVLRLDEVSGEISSTINKFGDAKSVFKLDKNGKITGIQDIRFNFKKDIDAVMGDLEKTLLGTLNAYVRPLQLSMMEMGANLAVGEGSLRMSLTSTKPKSVVRVEDRITGEGRIVRKFPQTKEGARKAKELSEKINEDYKNSGNESDVATPVDVGAADGQTAIKGRRDFRVEGYDAVGKTAQYMSAYFTETAVLDFLHSALKSDVSPDKRAAMLQQTAKMIIRMYPDDVVAKVKKDKGFKDKGVSDQQLATVLLNEAAEGKILTPTAVGSGRFLKDQLWAKALTFDERKDFYAMYDNVTKKTFNQLNKRLKHYELLTLLREKGLVLTDHEITNTPGLKQSSFVSLSKLSKQFPEAVDDIPGGFIAREVADGLIQQQNLLDSVFQADIDSMGPMEFFGGKLGKVNRELKRLAVVSILNGTMVRNFAGGAIVQAQMAEIPATMKYMAKATQAILDVRNGKMPKDPAMKELVEGMGGLNRAALELGVESKTRALDKQQKAQMDYLLSIFSGDKDAPPLGVSVENATAKGNLKPAKAVTKALGKRTSQDKYSESLNLSRDPRDVPPSKIQDMKLSPKEQVAASASKVGDAYSATSGALTTLYGSIDDVLRLAYGYELMQKGYSRSEANAKAMKVFYDYPDIPPIAQLLRDNVFFGFPFISYQLWSTKAFGNYFERNPLRATVLSGLTRGLEAATDMTLKLSQAYDMDLFEGAAEEDMRSVVRLPAVLEQATTTTEKVRLAGAQVPEQEARVKVGPAEADVRGLTVGVAGDIPGYSRQLKKSQEDEDVGFLGSSVNFLVDQKNMLGGAVSGIVGTGSKYYSKEREIQEMMAEATPLELGGGVAGGANDWVLEPALELLGYVASDARGFAKFISAYSGKPYAGQDKRVIDTVSNALGLAIRVADGRTVKNVFNNIGQSQIRGIRASLEALIREASAEKIRMGDAAFIAKKRLLEERIRKFEYDKDVFSRGRRSDGIKMRNAIANTMRAVLKYKPNDPLLGRSYQELLEYYRVDQEEGLLPESR